MIRFTYLHLDDICHRIISKFTLKGSPDETSCKQILEIEGPGLEGYFPGEDGAILFIKGKWTGGYETNDCLDLKGYPVRVYTTPDLSEDVYGRIPMDGLVRNIAFTNTATNTTVNTICYDNKT